MKWNLLICQILPLLVMCISSINASLFCYSDYLDIITCEWNRTAEMFHIAPTTNCSLHATVDDYTDYFPIYHSGFFMVGNLQPKFYKATLKLNQSLIDVSPTIPLKVLCGNLTKPVQEEPDFDPAYNVKLYPPSKPLVQGRNVTWEIGLPFPPIILIDRFQVQWRKIGESWETKIKFLIHEKQYDLPIENLTSGSTYEIRVRSTSSISKYIWSEWSPITQFTLDAPVFLEEPDILLGIITVGIAVSMLLLVIFYVFYCKSPLRAVYVPKSSYFDQLFSHHDGELKMWLGSGLLLKPELEYISPVKVCKVYDSDSSIKKFETFAKQSDNTSFSNSIYFLSKRFKCAIADQLEPCSSDSPYGPAGGNDEQEKPDSANIDNKEESEHCLETTSFDKQLQKLRLDVHSPDSGFAGSSIDHESQDESESEGLPSPPVVDSTLPISHVLPYPVPQLGEFHIHFKQTQQELNSWINQTLPCLPHGISFFSNLPTHNSDPVPCSIVEPCSHGTVEPCSDDYLSVNKVQD